MGLDNRIATVASPAKINLSLSVTGQRPDGFHELVSIVWPTRLCDYLTIREVSPGENQHDSLSGNYPGIPYDSSNLILKALHIVRSKVDIPQKFQIELKKEIPPASGLGGGSSNAVALLKLLAEWYPDRISPEVLKDCAIETGSDCLLFLYGVPCLMTGRGENCAALPESVATSLSGKRVWLIRPDVGISTAAAFRRLAARRSYTASTTANKQVSGWMERVLESPIPLIGNDFEQILTDWIPTFPLVLHALNRLPGTFARLSGSGSAIYCFPGIGQEDAIFGIIRDAWGDSLWLAQSSLV